MNQSNQSLISDINNSVDSYSIVYVSLQFFGILTNLINIIIFSNSKLKDPSYKFTLALSINSFINLIIGAFRIFISCGPPCSKNRASIYGQIYLLFIDDFLTSSLNMNATLIEIYLSLQRLMLIMNRPVLQKVSAVIFVPILAAISVVIYIPIIFIKTIYPIESSNSSSVTYGLRINDFGSSTFGKALPTALTLIRIILVIGVIFVVNLITSYKFKKYMDKKHSITNVKKVVPFSTSIKTSNEMKTNNEISLIGKKNFEKKNKNLNNSELKTRIKITLMMLIKSFSFILGTVPFAVYYILTNYVDRATLLKMIITSVITMISSQALDFFIYFIFNNVFRSVAIDLFKSILKM
ncbi:unnamed protein product [Brachionus calyciflorus]|uniref:G-protein coupled receptors family 1 profile domain-containing protein n=1 Tax=Brachionus calyciflorus TaxID=104777 RepID=A0A813M9N1_9BILA|nr:unnamed protein product [Brachionus calyciflorus]